MRIPDEVKRELEMIEVIQKLADIDAKALENIHIIWQRIDLMKLELDQEIAMLKKDKSSKVSSAIETIVYCLMVTVIYASMVWAAAWLISQGHGWWSLIILIMAMTVRVSVSSGK
jgi:hypothetical protein